MNVLRTLLLTPYRLRVFLQHSTSGMLFLAVVVGLFTAGFIKLFRIAIEFFEDLFRNQIATQLFQPEFGLIIALALAGALVGYLRNKYVKRERYHGIAGIIETVAISGGKLPYWKLPIKSLVSSISLGAGASVGAEDPSVQIGSNFGAFISAYFHLNEDNVALLVASGAAAATAAIFHAPIAGVFFALEVILVNSFSVGSISVVIVAAVTSTAITQAMDPALSFESYTYPLGPPLETPLFIPLGLVIAPVSVIFIRLVYWQTDFWNARITLHPVTKTAITGAVIGFIGLFIPQLLGDSSETLDSIITGEVDYTFAFLLVLAGGKIILTTFSIVGGFLGGVFAPSLFIGTVLGAAYGQVINQLYSTGSGEATFAVAGMAGMMAGVIRAPITAIMIVFEVTNDYRLILPIMLTSVVCVLVTNWLKTPGIYQYDLLRHGVHVKPERDIDLMQGVLVEEAMVIPPPVIHEDSSLFELRNTLREMHSLSLCVLDKDEKLSGIVTLSDLQNAYKDEGSSQDLMVGDICTRDVLVTYPDEAVWSAIKTMSSRDVGRLPVVKRGTREVIGIIGRHGVVRAYNIAITRKLQDQYTAEKIRLNHLIGAHIYEVFVAPTAKIANKEIHEIQWPPECVVASVQRANRLIVPHGDTKILANDTITLVADPKYKYEIERLFDSYALSRSPD